MQIEEAGKNAKDFQENIMDGFGSGASFYGAMLAEICREEGISLDWISNRWLGVLKKNEQTHYVVGYKFEINSAAAASIMDDKFATFEVMRIHHVPMIEHSLLYEFANHDTFAEGYNTPEYFAKCFDKYQRHVVIKPNTGTQGRGVQEVRDLANLEEVLNEVFRWSYSASITPFYDLRYEYRVVMLDGEARLLYRKERQDDWRFNLHNGAQARTVTDQNLRSKLVKIAKQACAAAGARFCSVDIVETKAGELLLMELNSGVTIERFLEQHPKQREKVKAIYQDAVRKMFE